MISLRNLCKRFGDQVVLDDVCLEVKRGETVVLLGPSGSGKTTLLRCIVGLEQPDSGEIELDGIVLNGHDSKAERAANLKKVRERCGFVFQQFHLFPHLTVLQNLTLGLRHVRKMNEQDATALADVLLQQVGLGHGGSKRPVKLSGGEQQRAA